MCVKLNEKYAGVEGKWLWPVNAVLLDLHSDDICFAVLGL